MPRDQPQHQQEHAADEQSQCRGFTQRTTHVAEEQVQQTGITGSQRSGTGHAVGEVSGGGKHFKEASAAIEKGLHPSGHIAAERQQQEHSSGNGGVGKVAAQSAEQLLDDCNGKDAADCRFPQGQRCRQVQSQQHAGEHGTAVGIGGFFLHQFLTDHFGEHADDSTEHNQKQCSRSKDHRRRHDRRHQSQHHQQHDLLRGHAASHVR